MPTRLIYHTPTSAEGGLSPFDEAICSIVHNSDIDIACPYLGLNYLKRIFYLSHSWRILTDVEEWLAVFSDASRQKIYNFISEHSESIRHCKDLHAKVILGGDKALLGSANFTKKGITGRTEVSVFFEAELQVEELKEWFDYLWLQSSPVQLNEVYNYINLLPPQGKTKKHPEFKELSSNAPKIRSHFLAHQYPQKSVKEQGDDLLHERLVQIIRQAPNREWAEEYFDIVGELLDFTGLSNEDPRFALSLPQSNMLKVIINRRDVLVGLEKGKPTIGFLLERNFEELPKLINMALRVWYPKPFREEAKDNVPCLPHLQGFPKQLLTLERKKSWKKAILSELVSRKSSSFRRHHQPVVYKAVVDLDYRSFLLDRAFQRIPTS